MNEAIFCGLFLVMGNIIIRIADFGSF